MGRFVSLSTEIMPATTYVESLRQKYKGFDFPAYKLREWFSTVHLVFFDCKLEENKTTCLEQLLKRTNLEAFTIFFVVKEQSGAHKFMDASFRNLGTETLERFINRYHQQLESMTKLSIQTIGLEYLECIGHSYQEPTEQT